MASTLITGMSATGKSTAIEHLLALGLRAVDLDTDQWSQLVPDDSEFADSAAGRPLDRRWREDRVRALLTGPQGSELLFVAGTSTYQGRLYPLLSHVVLLTIPDDVAMARLAGRTTNDYGKDAAELAREVALRPIVEPVLRAGACLVIDTSVHPPGGVAAIIDRHARSGRPCGDGRRSSAGAPAGTSGDAGATGRTGA